MADTIAAPATKPLADMTMLVVDDDEVSLVYAGAILHSGGAVVTSARSGEEGFALAVAQPFALLVIDLEMPGMHGQELLQKLRALPDRHKACTPVLVVSAGSSRVQANILAGGATAYVSKPVTPEGLIVAATAALAVVDNLDRQGLRMAMSKDDFEGAAARVEGIRLRQPALATTLAALLAQRDGEALLLALSANRLLPPPTTGTSPAARFAISIGVQQAFRAAANDEVARLVELQRDPQAGGLRSVAHRLAGAAATFGHSEICKQARAITHLLEETDDVDIAGLAQTLEITLREGGFGPLITSRGGWGATCPF